MSNPGSAVTAFDNDQPSIALSQLLVTGGVIPSRGNGGTQSGAGIPVGAFMTFAGNFAINGTVLAQGQSVSPVSTNYPLFTFALGTMYGGDGSQNYDLPDLQGRTLIGAGQAPGLQNYTLAAPTGSNTVTLSAGQMPTGFGGSGQTFYNDQPSLPITYLINTGGSLFGDGTDNILGAVIAFAGNFAPQGFMEAAGQTLTIADNLQLFAAIGTLYGGDGTTTFKLPDLRGHTLVGASAAHPLGQYFGQEQTAISSANLPASAGGQGTAIDTTAPSLAVNYIIATTGVFPSRDDGNVGTGSTNDIYYGEVMAYAGTNPPAGWAFADGASLPISGNEALFTILGTTYGGDGITTFNLPDLRGRTIVGTGNGLTVGTTFGSTGVTLTAGNVYDAAPTLNAGFGMLNTEQTPGLVSSNATVSDANLDGLNGGFGNYAGTTLTIQRYGGPNIDDQYGFATSGAEFLFFGGVLSNSGGTHPFAYVNATVGRLSIAFTGAQSTVTTELIDNVLRHITYTNHSDTPPASVTLDWTFSDGNSGSQGATPTSAQVSASSIEVITAVNDAPTISLQGTADIVAANAGGSGIGALLGDGAGNFSGGTVGLGSVADPLAVAVGDLNGDGASDIVSANGGGSLGVSLGDGKGGFSETNIPVAFLPQGVKLADFNGDGNLDAVLVGASGSGELFLGDGHGGFTAGATFSLPGTNEGPLVTGDFNGDGKMDFVAGSTTPGATIRLFTGDGAGGFTASGIADAANGTFGLAAGDLNGDGLPDIVATSGDGTVQILLNFGGGVFLPSTQTVGSSPSGVAIGDVDGDGFADIVVANKLGNSITVLSGDGSGGVAGKHSFSVGASPQGVVLADINGDGLLDILVGTQNSGITLLREFGGLANIPTTIAADGSPVALAVANLDTAQVTTAGTALAFGAATHNAITLSDVDSGGGNESFTLSVSHGTLTLATQANLVSVTGDGTASVAITGTVANINAALDGLRYLGDRGYKGNDALVLHANDGGGTGTGGALTADKTVPISITAAKVTRDFNGDGNSDLLWQDTATGQLSLWQMPSTGSNSVNLGAPLASGVQAIGTGDFNGDGKADILLRNTVTGKLSIWLMDGAARLAGSGNAGPLPVGWNVVATGDFNGDGKTDIVTQNATSGNVKILFMDGSTRTGAATTIKPVAGWSVIGSGDFNGDGKSDLLLFNAATSKVDVWLMDGATRLSSGNVATLAPDWSVVATGDFDGDGKTDIVTQNTASSNIKIWYMDGATKTGTGTTDKPGEGWMVTGSGDFNGDGISDLAMDNANGHAQVWYMSGATTLTGSGQVGAARGSDFHLVTG